MPMSRHAIPNHFAVEHTQGRKQRSCAIAFVVVRHRSAPALLQWQSRLSPVESLDLTLFVHTQYQRLVGRIQIKPNNVAQLFDKTFVSAELERFGQVPV